MSSIHKYLQIMQCLSPVGVDHLLFLSQLLACRVMEVVKLNCCRLVITRLISSDKYLNLENVVYIFVKPFQNCPFVYIENHCLQLQTSGINNFKGKPVEAFDQFSLTNIRLYLCIC